MQKVGEKGFWSRIAVIAAQSTLKSQHFMCSDIYFETHARPQCCIPSITRRFSSKNLRQTFGSEETLSTFALPTKTGQFLKRLPEVMKRLKGLHSKRFGESET
ncbi:hypothetical protein DN068_00005 [Taibaiella soli]|uniref:Uncharacterized protein n=1 Tax=Taibaiella soli TaxID=1649169 RepID=A0A2W2AN35_9BACT|nr:hypothetical protein DN068_00005 [Taibaiella soli]